MCRRPPVVVPALETHLIDSGRVDQQYRIEVMQPLRRRDEAQRFATLYLTDANAHFGMASGIVRQLQLAGEIDRFILVGIGYPGDNPLAGELLRRRDYIPPGRGRLSVASVARLIDGVIRPPVETVGRADDFLAFVGEELIPFIDDRYPTIAGERGYAGHSLGGGLGVHAMLTRPALFGRYIIASPSLSFDGDDYLLAEAAARIAAGADLGARLFLGVGAEEELAEADAIAKARMVSSACRLAAMLREADLPDLDLSLAIHPGETHASVWPVTLTHGLRRLFPPAKNALALLAPSHGD